MIDLRKDFEPEEVLAATVRFMMDIMASGKSEASRVAAAKLLMEHAGRQAEVVKKTSQVPVIQYIITGDPPPLGEGEYDSRVVDEEGESDEPDVIVKDCE